AVRRDQFHLLAHACRPFVGREVWTDDADVPWAVAKLDGHVLAVPLLGEGWVFDPFLMAEQPEDLAQRRQLVAQADDGQREKSLDELMAGLRLGPLAAGMLWALTKAVREDRCSIVRRRESWFFRKAWGRQEGWPKDHRRQVVLEVLRSLACLHVA